jgi:hypothetical protein
MRLAAPLAALALGACAPVDGVRVAGFGLFGDGATPETVRLAAPLGPVARPSAPLAGDFAARDLLTGETLRFDVSRTAGGVRVRQSDGCVWTRADDWFAPSDSWANCDDSVNWRTGSAKVRRTASIWPLQPGAEGRWTRDAVSHTGRSYTRDTVCRVVGAEAVVREGRAPTPAHVVRCTDGKRVRTTWFAPGEGPIAFRKTHETNGVEEAWVRL